MNGNQETVTTPNQATTNYNYDNLNRQTGISMLGVEEAGTPVIITSSKTYNWEGKVLTTTDSNNNATSFSYNKRGFIENSIDVKGGITAFWYDREGRKIAEVSSNDYDAAKTLEQMNRVVYVYDNMNRLKTKTYIGEEKLYNATTEQWTSQQVSIVQKAYKYDNSGNVIKELDALGYEAGTGIDVDIKIQHLTRYHSKTDLHIQRSTFMTAWAEKFLKQMPMA